MARFHGNVGFSIHKDDQETGIAGDQVIERPYYGTVTENSRRWQGSDTTVDDLIMGNQIVITGNDYAFRHQSAISYVTLMGVRWKVTGMRVNPPKITLTLGGVYNGPIPNGAAGQAAGHCS